MMQKLSKGKDYKFNFLKEEDLAKVSVCHSERSEESFTINEL